MTITFFTNFINHHQTPLADELYKRLGDDYKMVTFEPLPKEFIKRGYKDYSYKPYLIEAFKDDNKGKVEKLIIESDIVIFGAAPEELLEKRLSLNKLTYRGGERLFKYFQPRKGIPWIWDIIRLIKRYSNKSYLKKQFLMHTKNRKKDLWMLGASGYCANDTRLTFSYPKKVLKFGYFIPKPDIDIDTILNSKTADKEIKILWCGTICQVKRPDLIIELASKLKERGYSFKINMIGSGEWEPKINYMINNLDVNNYVTLLGNVPNQTVLEMMRSHHIFIFSSDRGEGWGVVLNEALANGCAVVASNKIGAVPFLLKDKETGILFKSGNVNSLYKAVKTYLDNPELIFEYSKKGFEYISNYWSADSAAKNMLQLFNDPYNNPIQYGPCSKAFPVKSRKLLFKG